MALSSAASVESLMDELDWGWSSAIGASDCGGGLGFLAGGGPIGGFIVIADEDVSAGSLLRVSGTGSGGGAMAVVIVLQMERQRR